MNRVDQHPGKAFAVALCAVALLSIMDAVMKHLVIAIGIIAVSIWRAVANLVLSGGLYLPRRLPWPSRKTLRLHVARGVLVTLMAFLFFWGIGRVPLAQAIALTFIAPLISLVLASMLLGEQIGRRSLSGSAIAFAGVVVIVTGQADARLGFDVLLGSAAIIGSALCYAGNIVMMRSQALAAKPLEINFFQAVTVMAVWLAALPFVGIPALPGWQWLWIAVASVLSTCGTLLYGWAYARGEASYLAVTEYSAFLWASALGWFVFREQVSLFTLAGAMLIVSGCLFAARRKHAPPPEIDIAAWTVERSAMPWLWLIVGGFFEVGFTTSLRFVDGFRNIPWTLAFLASVAVSMGLLEVASRSIPMGTAYAVWGGIGAVGTVVVGLVWFHEPASMIRVLLILAIVAAIGALKLTS